jgi:hypothetical protein
MRRWMQIPEVAQCFGVREPTVWRWLGRGTLPHAVRRSKLCVPRGCVERRLDLLAWRLVRRHR